jgi:hypothetical protein
MEMMNEFDKNKKMFEDYRKIKEERHRNMSYDSLKERVVNRLKTTMIGAISSIEDKLGFLWGHNEDDLDEQQLKIKVIFDELRKEILDKGNNQIRGIDSDLLNYDIIKKEIKIVLPVDRRGFKNE